MSLNRTFFMLTLVVLAAIGITGCNNQQKFTRELWHYGDGLDFPSRKNILDDLLANHKIVGLNHYQVVQLLGSPQFRDTSVFKYSYQIEDTGTKYNPKKKPIYTKNLVLYFSKDSIVTKKEVTEKTREVK
ncbi:outer membrane protein assembly factor BamE [Mucilaginibacter calamicampi]|uniref:Outer membrane protein assembly factor BamE n=1 Tax=Mucilaginibacter calamicampi TaxID=1302352 RepID=A0ABW2YZK5_9SPHI